MYVYVSDVCVSVCVGTLLEARLARLLTSFCGRQNDEGMKQCDRKVITEDLRPAIPDTVRPDSPDMATRRHP